jgi:hypothetical protein
VSIRGEGWANAVRDGARFFDWLSLVELGVFAGRGRHPRWPQVGFWVEQELFPSIVELLRHSHPR